jgi:hypothetical protein
MNHVVAMVTDGGANFVSATNQLCGERAMRCAAHTIQLALKDAARVEPMAGILGAVMRVLVRFAKSPMRREALTRAAEEAGVRPLMPIYPVATRWDSNYDALHRFYQLRSALERLKPRDLGFKTLPEWQVVWQPAADALGLLSPLCDVLEVFARWTRELQSANRVTLSRIPAACEEMLAATAPGADDVETIATIKSQLHAAVGARLAGLASSPLVRLAQFFDPTQFRDRYHRDERGKLTDEAKADLRATTGMLARFVDDSMERMRNGSPPADDDSSSGMMLQVWEQYSGWASVPLAKATARYLDCDKADAEDPLQWWRLRASDLAPLDAMARWFLCIPATSAESERTFSLAGWLVSSTRTRLSGSRVNDLVLLRRHLSREAGPTPARVGSMPNRAEAETDNTEASDEGDQMADLIDEGIVNISSDGVLVPSCDVEVLSAQPNNGAPVRSPSARNTMGRNV